MQRTTKYMMLIFCVLILNSCKKDDNKPNDFRDKYIGKYKVHEKIKSYGSPICGEQYNKEKDTIISVNYGNTDSTINVLGRDVYLDSAGCYYAYHYSLKFRYDSIVSYFMNGGLGCGQYEIYNGYRISKKP